MRQDPNNAGPDVGFGSGFLLESRIVATNAHVVATCTEKTLIGISTANIRVRFSRVISDKVRDLALLVPAEKLTGGFRLATPPTRRSARPSWWGCRTSGGARRSPRSWYPNPASRSTPPN